MTGDTMTTLYDSERYRAVRPHLEEMRLRRVQEIGREAARRRNARFGDAYDAAASHPTYRALMAVQCACDSVCREAIRGLR